ncbi:hypothetical protein ACKKBG_A25370 [Auxenochlorella protothecoides x Auxenochlorella symbiontica]
MKTAYILLALAVCGIGAQVRADDAVHDYDNLVATLTQNILGNVKDAASGLSNVLPNTAELQSEVSTLTGQLENLYTTFESQFCTEAEFDFGRKRPATFTGPSFDITFSTGSCSFNETVFWKTGEKELNCVEPSIEFTKEPAVFVSKRKTPITFTSKYCNVNKTFGEEETTILYSFDGSKQLSVNDLTSKITDEVKQALSTLTSSVSSLPSSLTNLVDSIPTPSEIAAQGAALKAGLLNKGKSPAVKPPVAPKSPAVPVSGARASPAYSSAL